MQMTPQMTGQNQAQLQQVSNLTVRALTQVDF
jgi:hypothetical protein